MMADALSDSVLKIVVLSLCCLCMVVVLSLYCSCIVVVLSLYCRGECMLAVLSECVL